MILKVTISSTTPSGGVLGRSASMESFSHSYEEMADSEEDAREFGRKAVRLHMCVTQGMAEAAMEPPPLG